MKNFNFYKVEDPEDCIRIREILYKLGYDVTLRDAEDIWTAFSEDMCACWIILPESDEELAASLTEYLNENF